MADLAMGAERIRIRQVITRLIVGGAQETAILACARLDPGRFDASLLTGPQTGPEGELHTWGREVGVRIDVEPALVRELVPPKDVLAFARLRRRFHRECPQVVHTNSSKAGILGRVAARAAGVPHVVHTVHGWSFHECMPAWERELYIRLERWAARFADRLVVVSERDREKGLAEGIGDPDRYVLIRSGIDLAPYRHPDRGRDDVRAELRLPSDAPVVGTVSRLSTQKDPLAFIDAAVRVARDVPGSRFLLVGDGPLRPEVEERIRGTGLGERFVLTGIRRDVSELLAAMDIFLVTSRWEGLPRTVPQAMAAGVPVVAGGVDGVAEALEDGVSGLLVSDGHAEGLADAVLRVLSDPNLREHLRRGGRARAEAFDEGAMIAGLEDLYVTLVEGRVTGPSRGA